MENLELLAKRVGTGLQKLSLALKTQAWHGAEQSGLTPTQGQVLSLLQSRGELRLNDVAESLGIRASTASESVRVLVEKGYIQKQRATDDARAVSLALTEAGRREAQLASAWPDFLVGAIDTLSPSEQEALFLSLVKMIRTLQTKEQIPNSRMCVSCDHFKPNEDPNSADKPHSCAMLGQSMGTYEMRIDCPTYHVASKEEQERRWTKFSC
jgi:DNA-binding MarR family transcriptional regulator